MTTKKKYSFQTVLSLLLCSLISIQNPSESCMVAVRIGKLGNMVKILPGRNGLILITITDRRSGNPEFRYQGYIYLSPSDTEICTFWKVPCSSWVENVFMLHNTVKKSNSVQGETRRKCTVKLLSIMREIKQHFGTFKFFSSPPLLISKVPKTVRSPKPCACEWWWRIAQGETASLCPVFMPMGMLRYANACLSGFYVIFSPHAESLPSAWQQLLICWEVAT